MDNNDEKLNELVDRAIEDVNDSNSVEERAGT